MASLEPYEKIANNLFKFSLLQLLLSAKFLDRKWVALSLYVTVYFPIVIGISDIFRLLPISTGIGRYTVNEVQERHMAVAPLFGKKFCTHDEL